VSSLGLTELQLYGVIAGACAVGILAVILIVIFGIPSVRMKVLPYRDRKHHAMSKEAIY